MKSRVKIGAGLAAAIAASQVITPSASGYVLQGSTCRYDPVNDDDGLGIGFSSTNYNQSRRDSTVDAAGRWNAAVAPQFTVVGYGSSTRDLRVTFARLGAGGVVAQVTTSCGTNSNYYTQDPLFQWNLDVAQPTVGLQTVTAIHELGHSYGLAHNQVGGCDLKTAGLMFTPSAQKSQECNWVYPTIDDINGQVDAHNG